jgi:hypothetical protein
LTIELEDLDFHSEDDLMAAFIPFEGATKAYDMTARRRSVYSVSTRNSEETSLSSDTRSREETSCSSDTHCIEDTVDELDEVADGSCREHFAVDIDTLIDSLPRNRVAPYLSAPPRPGWKLSERNERKHRTKWSLDVADLHLQILSKVDLDHDWQLLETETIQRRMPRARTKRWTAEEFKGDRARKDFLDRERCELFP